MRTSLHFSQTAASLAALAEAAICERSGLIQHQLTERERERLVGIELEGSVEGAANGADEGRPSLTVAPPEE